MASALVEAGYDCGVVRWVEQIVGELLANAMLHGCREPGDRFHLQVTADDHTLLVEVQDPGADRLTAVGSWPDGENGRGLLLVEALAEEWGVIDQGAAGKTVWARLSPGRLASLSSEAEATRC